MNARGRRWAGFTLVEVLAAMVFLGILVPAVLSALSVASRTSTLAERNATATLLAQNKLNELQLNNEWSSGESQGEFDQEFSGYHWALTSQEWTQSTEMTELTVTVTFQVQGRDYSAPVSTLVKTSQ